MCQFMIVNNVDEPCSMTASKQYTNMQISYHIYNLILG